VISFFYPLDKTTMRAVGWLVGFCLVVLVGRAIGYGTPTLLYSGKGFCEGNYCERGWYSSPAVVTNPTNGQKVIVAAAYSVAAVDAASGDTIWKMDSPGGGRVWPGVVVADADKNGKYEVMVASGSGYVAIYDLDNGTYWSSAWPRQPGGVDDEWRALAVADFNQDGDLELAIGRAYSGTTNTYVLDHHGGIVNGFPRPQATTDGYSWGVYNNNFGVADMDGDGKLELISPSDVHYVCAYESDGTPVPVDKGVFTIDSQVYWGNVGFYINQTYELQGYGPCTGSVSTSTIRTNFADGPVAIADLDNDGTLEYVLVGRTYYCTNPETTTFNGVHIVKGDRTRYAHGSYDWHVVPTQATYSQMGDPISMDYNDIESATYNPVIADLDNDGEKEILYSSYDGKLHAWWLDKTEKHSWPFNLQSTGSGKIFASSPLSPILMETATLR